MDQISGQPVTWRSWVKSRLLELAISLVLFWAAIQVVEFVRAASKAAVAASEWMVVREVFVPHHVVGENPEIIYDRDVLAESRGFWIVEVQRRDSDGLNFTECSGAGVNEYETTDVIPGDKVRWDWFIGRECAVGPGTYRLRISYDLTREGYPVKSFIVLSNTFNVTGSAEDQALGQTPEIAPLPLVQP